MEDYQARIYDNPATKVNIRYLKANPIVPWESEFRIDWEGRDIGFFTPASIVNAEMGIVPVWVWDSGGERILFEMPGDDVNATGRRLWASREWLDKMRVS